MARVQDSDSSASAAERRTLRFILFGVALGTMLAPLNTTLVALALPEISSDFDASLDAVTWTITAYVIAMAVVQPIGGKLGDLYGRRRVFLISLLGFGVASVLAAVSVDLAMLIETRIAQAVTAAMMLPTGAALVRQVFPLERRAAAFGVVGAAAGLAAGVGPALGGGIMALGGWRAMFWMNVPIVVLGLTIAFRYFPSAAERGERPPFDLAGAVLLGAAMIVFATLLTVVGGASPGVTAGLAAATAVLVLLFAVNERRVVEPLTDPRLFGNRFFLGATGTILFSTIGLYGIILVAPLLLKVVQERGSAETGLIMAAISAPVFLLARAGGRLADRLGRRRPAMVGGVLQTAGATLLLILDLDTSAWPVVGALLLMGMGLSLQIPAAQTAAVEAVEEPDSGMASGVYSMGRYVGSLIGAAALGALVGTAAVGEITTSDLTPVFILITAAVAASIWSAWFIRPRRLFASAGVPGPVGR